MVAARAELLNREPEVEPDALPCPFCGAVAVIQYWHGGPPTKRMISCSDDSYGCEVGPKVTGDTREFALRRWNRRT